MKINKVIKLGEVVEVNQTGKELAIVKAANGLRVVGFDVVGSKVLDTEITQGDNLSGLNCVKLEFTAREEQKIIIWYSNFKYKFEKQSDRVRDVRGYGVPLRHGVRLLLSEDPARVGATITAPTDIYIGGSNMKSGAGIVVNGRKFESGETFKLSNYGDVFYWVSDEEKRVFRSYSKPAKYAENEGRSVLEANGIDYFDIDVPPELDGVPFEIKAKIRHKTDGEGGADGRAITVAPALYITSGDETTEELIVFNGYGGSGVYDGNPVNDKRFSVQVTLDRGVHRVFVVESELDYDARHVAEHSWYGESYTTFLEIYTDNPVLSVKGYAQVLEERA